MSVKYFCDICGVELIETNVLQKIEGSSLHVRYGKLGIQFIMYNNNTSNSGDHCKYCIFDAIAGLDDRPIDRGERL